MRLQTAVSFATQGILIVARSDLETPREIKIRCRTTSRSGRGTNMTEQPGCVFVWGFGELLNKNRNKQGGSYGYCK